MPADGSWIITHGDGHTEAFRPDGTPGSSRTLAGWRRGDPTMPPARASLQCHPTPMGLTDSAMPMAPGRVVHSRDYGRDVSASYALHALLRCPAGSLRQTQDFATMTIPGPSLMRAAWWRTYRADGTLSVSHRPHRERTRTCTSSDGVRPSGRAARWMAPVSAYTYLARTAPLLCDGALVAADGIRGRRLRLVGWARGSRIDSDDNACIRPTPRRWGTSRPTMTRRAPCSARGLRTVDGAYSVTFVSGEVDAFRSDRHPGPAHPERDNRRRVLLSRMGFASPGSTTREEPTRSTRVGLGRLAHRVVP